MKICKECKIEKPLSDFHKHSGGKDGTRNVCKECGKAKMKLRYLKNKSDVLKKSSEYRNVNRDRIVKYLRAYYETNKKALLEQKKKYSETRRYELKAKSAKYREQNRLIYNEARRKRHSENPEKINALNARRRAMKNQATVSWSDEGLIKLKYEVASKLSKIKNEAYHVDHIVPLVSNLVCGLHTHTNLRVIRGSVNLAKGNRYWSDM